MRFSLEGSAIWLVMALVCAAIVGAAASCDPYALDAAIGEAVAGVVFLVGLALGVPLVGAVCIICFEALRDRRRREPEPVAPATPTRMVEHHAWVLVVNTEHGRRMLSARSAEGLKRLVSELPPETRREICASRQWRELNP